jgi:hypothetical protein
MGLKRGFGGEGREHVRLPAFASQEAATAWLTDSVECKEHVKEHMDDVTINLAGSSDLSIETVWNYV